MNNPKEDRKDRRYSISEYLEDEFRNVYIEIMMDEPVRAEITDISMNGAGFEIRSVKMDDQKKIESADRFFVNIHLAGEIILIDAKKTWGAFTKGKECAVFTGGLMFTMVSPNDRLALLKFLEKIRKRA